MTRSRRALLALVALPLLAGCLPPPAPIPMRDARASVAWVDVRGGGNWFYQVATPQEPRGVTGVGRYDFTTLTEVGGATHPDVALLLDAERRVWAVWCDCPDELEDGYGPKLSNEALTAHRVGTYEGRPECGGVTIRFDAGVRAAHVPLHGAGFVPQALTAFSIDDAPAPTRPLPSFLRGEAPPSATPDGPCPGEASPSPTPSPPPERR